MPQHEKKPLFKGFIFFPWWSIRDSNPWPLPCHGSALPAALMPHLYLFYHKNRKIEEEKTSAVYRVSDDSGDQTVLKEEEDLRFAFFPDPVVDPSG